MDLFPIFNVQNEIEVIEYLGTKEKFWFKYEDKLQLLKFGREGTGENWAEKVACELCSLLELPHAHYEFAQYNGRLGVLTPKMNKDGSRLVLGNELIDSAYKKKDGTRFYKYRGHTVSRVIAAITTFTDEPDVALRTFIGYLLLDSWIGNGDRHNENWGLVIDSERRSIDLAPTFDHASCLGRELQDEVRAERMSTNDQRYSVEAYTAKTRSGLYAERTDGKPLYTIEAFRLAGSFRKTNMDYWLKKLASINEAQVASIFRRIPTELISAEASTFAIKMLEINKNRLLG